MIIYGTRGMNSLQNTGYFKCPRCGPNRSYRHYAVKRWFTLYFIPVIPLGTAGEFVECENCAATWGTEVLVDFNNVKEVNIENARRMLILATARAGVTDADRLRRLQSALSLITSAPVDPDDLTSDLARANRSPARLRDFAAGCAESLSDAGKRDVIRRTAQVLTVGNRIGKPEQQALLDLGEGLGYRPDVIRSLSTEAPDDSRSLL